MKKIVSVLLMCLLLTSCTVSYDPVKTEVETDTHIGEYQNISPEVAKDFIDSGESVIILDVRTKEEYDEGHIENAILIPDNELKELVEAQIPDLDQRIFVYCRSGRRSKAATELLLEMGYTNVLDLGGIMDWPYEIVK